MKKRLTYVSPLQLGIVEGVVMAIISLIAVPFLLLGTMLAPHGAAPGFLLIIIIPVMYAVFGFIGGVIAAFVYNIVAKWTGGVEYIATESPQTA